VDLIRQLLRLLSVSLEVAPRKDAVAAFNPTERINGKTIVRVRP